MWINSLWQNQLPLCLWKNGTWYTISPSVNSFRDLGVQFDSDLKFSAHRSHVISKALRASGLLFRCLRSLDAFLFTARFKIYVIFIITYCFGLYTNPLTRSFAKIEKIQRLFTGRLYMGLYPDLSFIWLLLDIKRTWPFSSIWTLRK